MTTHTVAATGGDFTTIQAAIDGSVAGDTIIVFQGTYTGSINVNKDVTLISLDGAGTTFINGTGTNHNFSFAVQLTANGATFGSAGHGFTVNAGADEYAAVYIDHDDIVVEGNVITANAAAAHLHHALVSGGGIDDVTIKGNTFAGTASQLVYINGALNVANASDNVDFLENVFSGTSLGAHLVLDASNSEVTDNIFSGPGSAALVLQQTGNDVTTNNFGSFNGTDIVTTDLVFSLVGHPTAQNLAGEFAASGVTFTGNALDNELTGNLTWIPAFSDDFDDELSGLGGDDTLNGLGGSDELTGGLGSDTIDGGDGDDTINYTIGDGVDELDGGDDVDTLVVTGTVGDDVIHVAISAGVLSGIEGMSPQNIERFTLDGLGGSDTLDYSASPSGVVVNLTFNAATGFVLGTVLGIENVTGSATADTIAGDGGDNVITGGGGNDSLDGAGGDDTFIYRLGDGIDSIVGGNGTDTFALVGTAANDLLDVDLSGGVVSSIAGNTPTTLERYTVDGGAGVDTLDLSSSSQAVVVNLAAGTATGIAAVTGVENAIGGSGNDTFIGNASVNTFTGGLGRDLYVLGTGDRVIEAEDGGIDTVSIGITASLARYANVENLSLSGVLKINGTGNALANVITGNAAANILSGGDANDSLRGGAGRDTLVGGAGRDTLTGGADRDIFDFNKISESGIGSAKRDVITDFHRGNNSTGDDIDLKGIDANVSVAKDQAFKWIGTKAFSKVAGELHFKDLGSQVLIEGDVNGDARADFQILVKVGTLGASDFLL